MGAGSISWDAAPLPRLAMIYVLTKCYPKTGEPPRVCSPVPVDGPNLRDRAQPTDATEPAQQECWQDRGSASGRLNLPSSRACTVLSWLQWLWIAHYPGRSLSAIDRWRRNVCLTDSRADGLWRFAVHGVVPEGATMKPSMQFSRSGGTATALQPGDPRQRRRCPVWRLPPSSQSGAVPLELSSPECGTVFGIIIPPDVRLAGRPRRKRAHLGS